MHQSIDKSPYFATLTFKTLIQRYCQLQSQLVQQIRSVASKISQATPGQFLLLQFQMAQVTQMGESISNLIAQVMAIISKAITNQRTS